MVWPDGSWAFSRLLGDEATRLMASVSLVLAAVGFVAGGVGIFVMQAWWRQVVVVTSAFSVVIYLLLWDGRLRKLDNQGGIAILINLAILFILLILRWPRLGF
jgi:hypothetical protein